MMHDAEPTDHDDVLHYGLEKIAEGAQSATTGQFDEKPRTHWLSILTPQYTYGIATYVVVHLRSRATST
ncbi:hypothetical protein OE88DRAFT_1658111 [Heliocybe sulcata]|uniref:Uncharacterized protein n=1 Tax=Heliocybe sulcata TaxID=5364 RepID=A0A5C3N7D1_9AGAM|nr:hypothetical protein OE88DRAFT_1658111 [Heliocybe sulcata]